MQDVSLTIDTAVLDIATCPVCAIKLNELCSKRAWWFRPFREAFTAGLRLFSPFHPVPPAAYAARSPLCQGCLRLHKNAVRQGSPVFRWLDGKIDPLFSRVRDSLLTAVEIGHARELARRASDPEFLGW